MVTLCVCEDLLEAGLSESRWEKPWSPDKNLTLNSSCPAKVLREIGQEHGSLLPLCRADPLSEKKRKKKKLVKMSEIL